MSLTIQHNPADKKFETHLEGSVAFIDYELEGKNLTITHTEVPEIFRGKGVGGELVNAVLDHAKKENLLIDSRCGYATKQIAKQLEKKI